MMACFILKLVGRFVVPRIKGMAVGLSILYVRWSLRIFLTFLFIKIMSWSPVEKR